MYKYVIIASLVLINFAVIAQNQYAVSKSTYITFNAGPSKYLGDVGGQPTNFLAKLRLDNATFFGGVGVQRFFANAFAVEAFYNFGKLYATDATIKYSSSSDSEYFRYRRNLDFKTHINELQLSTSFFPFKLLNNKSTWYKYRLQPMLTIGAGYYSFNPQGTYFDDQTTSWVSLQPLHTEGQTYAEYGNIPAYKLRQYNIIYGGGFNYKAADNLLFYAQVKSRKLFTDYLDDVSGYYIDKNIHSRNITDAELLELATVMSDKSSQVDPFFTNSPGDIRGNNKKYDAYFTYTFGVSFRIAYKFGKYAQHYKYDDNETCR